MQATREIRSYPDTIGRGGLSAAAVPLAVLLVSASLASPIVLAVQPAAAQVTTGVTTGAPQASAPSPDDIKQREQELEAAREQQKKAAELQQKLKADIAAIGQDRSKLNGQ